MSKYNLFSNEEKAVFSLGNTTQSGALIIHTDEEDFKRLLEILETDFPNVKVIYKTLSVGKLWVMRGEPPQKER